MCCKFDEVCVSVLFTISEDGADDETFETARRMCGMWGDVLVEVHWFLVG